MSDFFFSPSLGLFEVRALEYLESIPETEPTGMNKILRSLGKGTSLLFVDIFFKINLAIEQLIAYKREQGLFFALCTCVPFVYIGPFRGC